MFNSVTSGQARRGPHTAPLFPNKQKETLVKRCLLATVAPFPHGTNWGAFFFIPPDANIIIMSPLFWKVSCAAECPPYEQTSVFSSTYLFFTVPSFRRPSKSFPWWWRVVFASSVDTVSSPSLTHFLPKALLLCRSPDFPWWNEQSVLFRFIYFSIIQYIALTVL